MTYYFILKYEMFKNADEKR